MRKLLSNQKGQGILEYIILTALVGIICLTTIKSFGSSLKTRINQINKKVQKEIDIN